MPPTDFVFSMVKNPPSIRALTTGLVSFRISSFSSEAAAIRGMRSCAFCTCGWTVGIVCLLLREGAARLITDGPGALVKRWPQGESPDEAIASPGRYRECGARQRQIALCRRFCPVVGLGAAHTAAMTTGPSWWDSLQASAS